MKLRGPVGLRRRTVQLKHALERARAGAEHGIVLGDSARRVIELFPLEKIELEPVQARQQLAPTQAEPHRQHTQEEQNQERN